MLGENYRDGDQEEVVIVLKVLAADVNQGYHTFNNWIVHKVNGEQVRSLAHLMELVENPEDGDYMEFEGGMGQQLVLDRDQVAAQQERILKTYRIAADRSSDLLPAAAAEGAES
jgi:hypothetical protein